MKILHVGYVGDLPQSGVANVVPKYIKHQAKYASVALLNLEDFTPADFIDDSLNLFRFSQYKGISSLPEPFSRPDLVVFHEVYRPQFIRLAKYCRSEGIPYVITPHVSLTDVAQRHKWLKKTIGNLLAFNRFVKGAKSIHFLSQAEKDQTSKFSKAPYFIRSNGIETHPRVKKVFNKDKLRLIYVGRLQYAIKGIDRILGAVNIIQEQMRELDIRVALYGPSRNSASEKIKKTIEQYGVGDLVAVSDGLFGEDKIKTIIASDCFIQLSRTEGQPLGIMEAMDLGMPCMVTRGTTFYDIAKNHYVGIPVADHPEEIAREMLNIRKGKYNLAELSSNASNFTKLTYDWSKVAANMIADYSRIVRTDQNG